MPEPKRVPPKPDTTLMQTRDVCGERTTSILIIGLGLSFCVPLLIYILIEVFK
jgi:hypothetical protein